MSTPNRPKCVADYGFKVRIYFNEYDRNSYQLRFRVDKCVRAWYNMNMDIPDPAQNYMCPKFADKIEEVIMSEEATELFRSLVLEGHTLRKIKGYMEEAGHPLDEYDAPYIKIMIDILTEEKGD